MYMYLYGLMYLFESSYISKLFLRHSIRKYYDASGVTIGPANPLVDSQKDGILKIWRNKVRFNDSRRTKIIEAVKTSDLVMADR